MPLLIRALMGVGMLVVGYYVGREVGRLESVREELRRARAPAEGPSHPGESRENDTTPG